MSSLGHVTKQSNGSYKGNLKTVSIKTPIEILPVGRKDADNHPDFRVMSEGVEVGAGWFRRNQTTGAEYVSVSIAAPEFGPRRLYANLGRAAGQDDDDVFALIWNPID